jgi:predicted small lipoprotein YifL
MVLAATIAACGRQGPLVRPGEEEPKRAKEVF